MAETLTIRTAASTEVIKIAVPGPQGPAGAPGTGLETLTTQGDTLYRGASTGERLPIGTAGQVLKVVNGLPAWANESGAVSSVAGRTGAITLNSTDIFSEQVIEVSEAGDANCNGVFVYGGDFNGRPTYYKDKNTFVYYDNVWNISHNADDKYFGTNTSRPWQAVWSLGSATGSLPVVDQLNGQEYEKAVGQRTNPTLRGDAAGKNVGTGANDVAAGNHTHSSATTTVAGFLSSSDKSKLDGIAAGAEVNVNADWNASSGDAQILNKPSSFTPSAHASSHHTGGTDAIAPNQISAAWALVLSSQAITANTLLSAGRNRRITLFAVGATANVDLPHENNQAGDVVTLVADFSVASTLSIRRASVMSGSTPVAYSTLATLSASGQSLTFVSDGTATGWSLRSVDTHTHAASEITSGTLDIARIPTGTSSTQVALGNHTHGNITNGGLVGTTSGLPLKTGTGGIVEAGAFGTSAGQFAEGNHTHTQLHDRSHAITSTSDHTAGNHKVFYSDGSGQVQELALGSNGTVLTSNGATSAPSFAAASGGVSSIGASAADILSVSGSDLVADDLGADKLYGWDDSAGKAIGFTIGSGLTVTDDTLSATASGGSKTYAVFTATDNNPPATSFASIDQRNSTAVLDFDDATDESAVFVGIIPEGASLGSGLKIRLHWMATTATSGNCVWDVSLERMTTDLDSDSFDTIASATATANGTSGILTVTEITLTTIDSVTAGDGFRLKVTRDANNASDTMSGDAELVLCEVRSAA